MVLILCNGQMYMIVFKKDIGEMSLWVCKLFAWKPTLDKIPCFLNLSHRNTINDNEVLCVGCVLIVNMLGTCSLNAIFFSRVWCGYFRWWGIHFAQYIDSPSNFMRYPLTNSPSSFSCFSPPFHMANLTTIQFGMNG